MMRRKLAIILSLLLLAPLAFAENKVKIEVNPGYTFVGTDDELTKVSEFESARSQATGEIKGFLKLGAFEGKAHAYYRDMDDKEWGADLDFGRVFRINYEYFSFIHRLQHDELYKDEPTIPKSIPPNNVSELVAMNPFWVWEPDTQELVLEGAQMVAASDLDAGKDYQIFRREQKLGTKVQLPFFPYVTLRAEAKEERESGWRQHTFMAGKCTPCHIVGVGRRINQYTRDVTVGGTIKYGIVTVDYAHTWRTFDDESREPTYRFDVVATPDPAKTSLFSSRLLYDGENEEIADIPDIEKQTDKLKVRVDLPYRTTFFGTFVYSSVENEEIDKDYDTTVYSARITTSPMKGLKISLSGKYYNIDSDDIYVDLSKWSNDNAFDAIYQNWGASDASAFNYEKRSNIDRDVWEGGIDVRYAFAKYYVRAGYKYIYIDRDHDEWKVYDNKDIVKNLKDESFLSDETTKIHKFKLTLGGHPINTLNFRITYKYEHQQDPFENHNGIKTDINMLEAYNAYSGVPYYSIFRNEYRTKDASNVPTDTHDIKLVADWTPTSKITASVNLGYKYQKNDDSDWEADTYVAGLNLLFMPMEKLSINLGANYEYATYETRMCVDLFGG